MPNRLEAEMLINAINGVGQSFAQNHRESSEQDYRKKALDLEIERQKSAEAHYGAENQHYKNMEQGQAAAAMDKDDQQTFKTLTELNATGALANRDAVNLWLKSHPKWGKVGLALQEPTQKPPPQVGQSSAAQALKIADDYDTKADAEQDPGKQEQLRQNAKILRDSARQMAMPKQNPADYDTVTEENPGTPGIPATPATPGGLFSKGTPAQPAVPGTPKTVIRRHVPRGTTPTVGTGTTKALDEQTARMYLQKAGGDKNKARAMATADGYSLSP
jgi:hypothetical protein